MELKNDVQLRNLKGILSNMFLPSEFSLNLGYNCYNLVLTPFFGWLGFVVFDSLIKLGFTFCYVHYNENRKKLVVVFSMPFDYGKKS